MFDLSVTSPALMGVLSVELIGPREIMMSSPKADALQNPGASFQPHAARARKPRECVNALCLSLRTDAIDFVQASLTNCGMLGI